MNYFGTDGIRGIVGSELSPRLAFFVGFSVGKTIKQASGQTLIVVGKDSRLSSDMISACVQAGISASGVDVLDVGILPTPAIAYLSKRYFAQAGIMITASHNPPEYNGIKVFGGNGFKITKCMQERIESCLQLSLNKTIKYQFFMGKISVETKGFDDYCNYLLSTIHENDFLGLKVCLDVCHGASVRVAPFCFSKLSADTKVLHEYFDGERINIDSGATDVKRLQACVIQQRSMLGFAYDGDADRVIAVDEKGMIVDGDKLLFTLAKDLKDQGKLQSGKLVGTEISSLGLEIALRKEGVCLERVAVGDENVIEKMKSEQIELGGEQCGHIIISNKSTTGDGILASLAISEIVKKTKMSLSELTEEIKEIPCQKVDFVVSPKQKEFLSHSTKLKDMISDFLYKNRNFSVVARASGTENKFRLKVEGKNKSKTKEIIEKISKFVKDNQM